MGQTPASDRVNGRKARAVSQPSAQAVLKRPFQLLTESPSTPASHGKLPVSGRYSPFHGKHRNTTPHLTGNWDAHLHSAAHPA